MLKKYTTDDTKHKRVVLFRFVYAGQENRIQTYETSDATYNRYIRVNGRTILFQTQFFSVALHVLNIGFRAVLS